ncbi:MAG: 1-deoxy-D-xylulose-5-phosphate synthase [Clostridiales bacterium]|nr:1-deoxy-D-xylulose-5-phosphate synthase [Clostridiales bacterium]
MLDSIRSPEDIKRIDADRLPELAEEIRSFLVEKVSGTGGHLASNLGVVELTIALHRVFDSPADKLIYDVGHQAYVHKILTGRAAEFGSLRQKDGISGFPKRSESIHDAFGTGHASTSVSAALGILRAEKMLGGSGHVVAVTGDGALTGGLCFEALNDAGQSKQPLIVVLNDNDMSISHNVGALNRHLNRMRTSRSYRRFKHNTAEFLQKLPKVGQKMFDGALRMKNRIKYFLIPNVLFEELGFTYLGPVDGHDIESLIEVLKRAKRLDAPVIIHAVTKKGKGYALAEENPAKFHGIGKFDIDTGIVQKSGGESNSSVFGKTLAELAAKDSRIVAITAAMPLGTGLDRFQDVFPSRFYDVGIAEEHAVTMAAGMAAAGAKPVAAVYSTFLQRAYDELLHDICLQGLPVVFGVDRAGLVGEDGETHQGVYDIAFLRTLPGMCILSPATQEELAAMIPLALSQNGPVAIRYNRGILMRAPLTTPVVIGKWEEIRFVAEGKIVLLASGRMVKTALLAAEGLPVSIVNARCLKPMDEEMLQRIKEHGKPVFTLEDGILSGGFGEAVKAKIGSDVEVLSFGVGEQPVRHASVAEQDKLCGMDADTVREKLLQYLEREA